MAIETKLFNVTPELARQWLERNTNNRPIRESHVERLRNSFERGEYHTTHQGISFDEDGVLLDGQHRLEAFARCPAGMVFPILVSRGLDRGQVFHAIDAVQVGRTAADVLQIPRPVVEVARLLTFVGAWHSNLITPEYIEPVCRYVQPEVTELLEYCPTARRIWSSTPSRAAAVLMMKRGHKEYAKRAYRAMVMMVFDEMPPAAAALFRSAGSGRVNSYQKDDLFVRCLRAYDPATGDVKMLKATDDMIANTCAETRTWMAMHMPSLKPKTTIRTGGTGLPGVGAQRVASRS